MNTVKNSSSKNFIQQIISGNISYLSRAITHVESNHVEHQKKATEILNGCLNYANKSIRIGITGVPGVGKSSFIEVFGKYLTSIGKRVAVLAVDPSSSRNKGSILGDKTRMNELTLDKNAFIRPSPSGNSLGGVARKTRESITLCEAAGFDIIIVETVGVGQSEFSVHSMVDFFLLLKLANAGDELQGIKRGIIEMADAIIINKVDGDNVQSSELAKTQFANALHLYPLKESKWTPKVSTCSSLNNTGINSIYKMVIEYVNLTKSNGYYAKNRMNQNKNWFFDVINDGLKKQFYEDENVKEKLISYLKKIDQQEINPFSAAQEILKSTK